MKIIKAIKDNFIEIKKDNRIYYGGNQSWWDEEDNMLQVYGCGIIAMCNIELYLKNQCEVSATIESSTVELYYDNYKQYVNDRCRVYGLYRGKLLAKIGLVPWRMVRGIKKFLCNDLSYNMDKIEVKWAPTKRSKNIMYYIEDMLDHNIPIATSYFTFKKKDKIQFFIYDEKDNCLILKQRCNSHYFNITGIVEFENEGDKYFRISSWGKLYYIRVEDWIRKLSYFSNILYIRTGGQND